MDQQPSLPLEVDGPTAAATTHRAAPPTPRPTGADDADDRPIAFGLTARARRAVAPTDLPALRVVGPPPAAPASPAPSPVAPEVGPLLTPRPSGATAEPAEDEEAGDTRPARARALRRAGARPAAIATQLGVDPLLVRAWTDGVRGVAHVTAVATPRAGVVDEDAARRAAFASRRTAARRDARLRLVAAPSWVGGLGVLAACTEVAPDAATLTHTDPRVAATAVRWADEVLGVPPTRWRAVLRLGERAAADLARARWGAALGLPPERLRTTRWAGVAEADAEEVRLRLPDPVLAATLAGWIDAVLDDPDETF